MIAIHIRHITQANGVHITDVSTAPDAEAMAAHVRLHGVYTEHGDLTKTVVCQYVIDDDHAFFELIVGEEN